MRFLIKNGDCLEVLKKSRSDMASSMVTDPPYGISFMNKRWDYDIPSVEIWRECLRVLRPGAHALVACGTRTQHRMVCNLEDAGFEIRDVISWIYGSGMPKSQNISKDLDKRAGVERDSIDRIRFDGKSVGKNDPSKKGWCNSNNTNLMADPNPITDKAKQWDGWGTALKPACEFWTLCRKPLSEKTIAENVLKWGTGGINIDGCRVESEGPIACHKSGKRNIYNMIDGYNKGDSGLHNTQNNGRWPANIIHDGSDEVLENFPVVAPSRKRVDKDIGINPSYTNNGLFSLGGEINSNNSYEDKGSAARFFYCSKASSKERENNPHPTVKPVDLMRYLCRLITPPDGIILDPFMGSGSTGVAALMENFRFAGIELNEDYFQIAQSRLSEL